MGALVTDCSAPALTSRWEEAKAAFVAARDAENVYDRAVWVPCNDAGVIDQAITDEMDRLMEVRFAAEDRLIEAPAPDLAAVTWKITYARERWDASSSWPVDWWDAVLADLRRLSGGLH